MDEKPPAKNVNGNGGLRLNTLNKLRGTLTFIEEQKNTALRDFGGHLLDLLPEELHTLMLVKGLRTADGKPWYAMDNFLLLMTEGKAHLEIESTCASLSICGFSGLDDAREKAALLIGAWAPAEIEVTITTENSGLVLAFTCISQEEPA